MKIALIGLGDIAQKAYLPIISTCKDITPILCTRNKQTLATLGNKYRINQQFTDIDELIKSGINGAMVHSSTESHPVIVEKLLSHGIATFVDKPISYHLKDTERLLNLAEQKGTPLFVGFNRRYAPLISSIDKTTAVHISLAKNRSYIPNNPRIFVYDDFIHVLDSLLFLSTSEINNLHVFGYFVDKTNLGSVHVQWHSGQTLLTGAMNRVCGHTEEVLEFYGQKQKWQINQLTHGWHYSENSKKQNLQQQLGFNDWQSTLYKRGFETMLSTFIAQVKNNKIPHNQLQEILTTHQLCEKVVAQLSTSDG
ncbi:MAG: Gfo/Idh/MocA family oxidoreductase [Alteromonadaceae bacterium]|nr:Gfo/Idh/MocA family oxidoreductase [Alteromonadaceae bacterium]